MNRKLFMTDLDGTLLTDEKTITPATRAALDAFVAAGNVFAFGTGRAMCNVLRVQKQFHLDYPGSIVVAFNGAEIYDYSGDRTIYRSHVEYEAVKIIMEMAKAHGVHCQAYNDSHIVCEEYTDALVAYRNINHIPVTITEDIMAELPKPPCKLLAIELNEPEKLENLRKDILRTFGDTLSAFYSSARLLEIFSAESSKGNALRTVREALGIPRENTFAAGDAENDISMILEAGTGIAMCNGSEAARKAADVITLTDNNHDGLVPFLRP